MLSQRLYDERSYLPATEIAFFMGVPFHKELIKIKRLHHTTTQADSWKKSAFWLSKTRNFDDIKLMEIYCRAFVKPDPNRDVEEISALFGKLTEDPFYQDAIADYWLIALQRPNYDISLLKEGGDEIKKKIKQGLEKKTIINAEDANRILRLAYLTDHVRFLREVIPLQPFSRVCDILQAVDIVIDKHDGSSLVANLLKDVLYNRVGAENEMIGFKHPLIMDRRPSIVTAKEIARMFLIFDRFAKSPRDFDLELVTKILEIYPSLYSSLPSLFWTCVFRPPYATFYIFERKSKPVSAEGEESTKSSVPAFSVTTIECVHSNQGKTHVFSKISRENNGKTFIPSHLHSHTLEELSEEPGIDGKLAITKFWNVRYLGKEINRIMSLKTNDSQSKKILEEIKVLLEKYYT